MNLKLALATLALLILFSLVGWLVRDAAAQTPTPDYALHVALHDAWTDAVLIIPNDTADEQDNLFRQETANKLAAFELPARWQECYSNAALIWKCGNAYWFPLESLRTIAGSRAIGTTRVDLVR